MKAEQASAMGECDRAALVEASFDGRLGPSEETSLKRHVDGCSACASLLAELTEIRHALREPPSRAPTPLEHQRARLALLRSAASPGAPRRRTKMTGLLAAALVLVSFAVLAASASRAWRRSTVTEATTLAVPSTKAAPRPVASLPIAEATPTTSVHAEPSMEPAPTTAPAKRTTPASSSTVSSASREFAHAMAALERGDFGAAATELAAFSAAHPQDPRAEEAAYLEAIALERAGRTSEARTSAQRYLARYPDGAHRAPALRLLHE